MRERESEREGVPPVCTLTGNRTRSLLVCGTVIQPTVPPGQGSTAHQFRASTTTQGACPSRRDTGWKSSTCQTLTLFLPVAVLRSRRGQAWSSRGAAVCPPELTQGAGGWAAAWPARRAQMCCGCRIWALACHLHFPPTMPSCSSL